jgi:hypothetical protein
MCVSLEWVSAKKPSIKRVTEPRVKPAECSTVSPVVTRVEKRCG